MNWVKIPSAFQMTVWLTSSLISLMLNHLLESNVGVFTVIREHILWKERRRTSVLKGGNHWRNSNPCCTADMKKDKCSSSGVLGRDLPACRRYVATVQGCVCLYIYYIYIILSFKFKKINWSGEKGKEKLLKNGVCAFGRRWKELSWLSLQIEGWEEIGLH